MKMSNDILEEYLTLDQIAKEFGLSKRTIVRWGQLRKGPPVTKIGRRNLYNIASVRSWLKQKEKE